MTLYDDLNAFCQTNGWHFVFGRIDDANLSDRVDRSRINLFLLNQNRVPNIGNFGFVTNFNYNIEAMLMVASDVDTDYLTKYNNNLKRAYASDKLLIHHFSTCDRNYKIVSWNAQEVINRLDENMDGLALTIVLQKSD